MTDIGLKIDPRERAEWDRRIEQPGDTPASLPDLSALHAPGIKQEVYYSADTPSEAIRFRLLVDDNVAHSRDAVTGERHLGKRCPVELSMVTFCVLIMDDGRVITGEHVCLLDHITDENTARALAKLDAVLKLKGN